MNKLLPLLLVAVAVPCMAQDDVTELLKAPRVKKYVNVEFQYVGGDSLFKVYYQIDTDEDKSVKPLKDSATVLSTTDFPI